MKTRFAAIKIAFFIFVVTGLFLTACARTTNPTPKENGTPKNNGQPSLSAKSPGDYFPLTQGSTWQYAGEGNEYAPFDREVLYTKDNLAQIRDANGGTSSSAVYKTTDDSVTRIFSQGEAYDDTNFLDKQPSENTVILKAPLKTGTKWDDPNGTREIVDDNATVDTPAGKFENCLKVKITSENSTLYEYFKDGVGMIKREFGSGQDMITSTLEKYTIK